MCNCPWCLLDPSLLFITTSHCPVLSTHVLRRVQRHAPFRSLRLPFWPGSDAKIAREGFFCSLIRTSKGMAHFVHGSSGRPKALPSFVISPPRSTPARDSTSVSSPPRPPTSCSESTNGSNRALTLYEGRITGRGGTKQSFHCTTSARLALPHRKLYSSTSSSSSSSSKFDPARLDCLRRHEALRRKREENVKVVRAREGLLYSICFLPEDAPQSIRSHT